MIKKLIPLCIFFGLICFSVLGGSPNDSQINITNTSGNTTNNTITNNTVNGTAISTSTEDTSNLTYGVAGLILLIIILIMLAIYSMKIKDKDKLKTAMNNTDDYMGNCNYINTASSKHDIYDNTDMELPKAKKPRCHMKTNTHKEDIINNIESNNMNYSLKSSDDTLDKSCDIPLNTNKSYNIFSNSNQKDNINKDSNTYDNIIKQTKFTDAIIHSTSTLLPYKYGDKAKIIEIKNAFGISHVGNKKHNEDNILIKKIKDIYLLAVADGVGGHEGGELASKLAVDILNEAVKSSYDESYSIGGLADLLKMAHEKAHYEIIEKSKEINKKGMATTLVSAIIKDNYCVIANTGDSRAYIIKENGKITRKTKDHSLVQILLDNGEISEEGAKNHPLKNTVISTIGGSEFKVDIYKENMEEGDILLMSSDGLHDYMSDDEIKTVIKTVCINNKPENIVEELLNRVLDKTNDNVSIIIYKF